MAFRSLTALVCGGMLLLARLLRLGFLGDFLSTSVLIGFLTGVGIQVLSGQIPGHARGVQGHRQLVPAAVALADLARERELLADVRVLGAATMIIIVGFKRFAPKVPGAVVAVVLLHHRVRRDGRLRARRCRGRRS